MKTKHYYFKLKTVPLGVLRFLKNNGCSMTQMNEKVWIAAKSIKRKCGIKKKRLELSPDMF
jgi:hypothetical protein